MAFRSNLKLMIQARRRTQFESSTKENRKQKTEDPQTQTPKHVPQASFLETFPTYLTFVSCG
jgi:hypothetical protein